MDSNDIFLRLQQGTRFNKKKYERDMDFFKTGKATDSSAVSVPNAVTAEMDFFGSAAATSTATASTASACQADAGKDAKQKHSSSKGKKKAKSAGKSDGRAKRRPSDDFEQREQSEEDDGELDEPQGGSKQTLQLASVKNLRKKHKIRVEADVAVVDPIQSFEHLQQRYERMPEFLVANVAAMGFIAPTAIQMQALPALLEGHEVLACAPTGSGKTAAFSLPMLAKLRGPRKGGLRGLVVCPTRELAMQTYQHIKKLAAGRNFRVNVLTKATSLAESDRRQDILVTTPLRLVQLLKESDVSLHTVEYLALDEADQLFEYGFLKQIDEIIAACSNPKVQRTLFSATMLPGVEEMARSFLRHPTRIVIGVENSATDTIDQKLIFCGNEEGKLMAIRQMIAEGFKPPVIIFVQSKPRAMDLFRELLFENINVGVITSDRTKAQRDTTVKNFRAGKIWVLIATDLMSRGMDFRGVNMVVNFDFPNSVVQYIHRIGRTGRAGRGGASVTLYTFDDVPVLRNIVNVMKASGISMPAWMKGLPKLSKREQKRLVHQPNERAPIYRMPAYDVRQRQKKRMYVASTKHRVQELTQASAAPSEAAGSAGAGARARARASEPGVGSPRPKGDDRTQPKKRRRSGGASE